MAFTIVVYTMFKTHSNTLDATNSSLLVGGHRITSFENLNKEHKKWLEEVYI
jgi:hypothetical protein